MAIYVGFFLLSTRRPVAGLFEATHRLHRISPQKERSRIPQTVNCFTRTVPFQCLGFVNRGHDLSTSFLADCCIIGHFSFRALPIRKHGYDHSIEEVTAASYESVQCHVLENPFIPGQTGYDFEQRAREQEGAVELMERHRSGILWHSPCFVHMVERCEGTPPGVACSSHNAASETLFKNNR